MKKTILIILTAAAVLAYAAAATDTDDKDLSDIEKARQTLQYGLESDILTLTGTVDKQDFETLQDNFISLFEETKSPAVREGIFGLYQKYENQQLVSAATAILESYQDNRRTLIKAVLAYLAAVKPPRAAEISGVLQKMITDETEEYGAEAAAVLGITGNAEDAAFLADFFETFSSDDPKQELIVKQAIATALEKLHSDNTREFLLERARDENENAYVRASAVSGLAQMETPDLAALLAEFFESPEPLLRTAAIKGAAAFNTAETRQLLLQGFKDTYYKVRLEAMQTVRKTKQQDAVPYVLYRAQHDPVEAVKLAAVETLAVLNASEGNAWLSETFRDEKKSAVLRVKILSAAFEHNISLVAGDLNTVVIRTVTDDRYKRLRYEMGKEIAKHENSATAEICKAFLASKDTLTKSIGLDMFKTNRYGDARSLVESIAQDDAQGTLRRRAKQLLE